MKRIYLLVALLSGFIPAFAFRILYGNEVTINEPVHDNLYVAGVNITISAPVYGDLVIAGGTVTINDSIANDILVAGGTVIVNGYTGGDIRCAGGKVIIRKNIAGDVVVTGGTVLIEKTVTVGNLITSSGNITVNGDVAGEIKGVFNEMILNGIVAKDLECRGATLTVNGTVKSNAILAAGEIVIGTSAAFNGPVRYWNRRGFVEFKQSLGANKAVYDPSLRIRMSEWYFLGSTTFAGLLLYLGMATLMILVIQYFFTAIMKKAADSVFDHSMRSLLTGLLFVIAAPIAIILMAITLVGIPLALISGFVYIVVILLATILCSVVAANWINNRYDKKWSYARLVLVSLGLFILLKLLSLVPFVGWVILCVLACMTFGGILMNIRIRKAAQGPALTM